MLVDANNPEEEEPARGDMKEPATVPSPLSESLSLHVSHPPCQFVLSLTPIGEFSASLLKDLVLYSFDFPSLKWDIISLCMVVAKV